MQLGVFIKRGQRFLGELRFDGYFVSVLAKTRLRYFTLGYGLTFGTRRKHGDKHYHRKQNGKKPHTDIFSFSKKLLHI